MRADTDLKQAIITELSFERSITTTNIEVDVDDGHVTLSGTVSDPEQRGSREGSRARRRGCGC